MTTTTPEFIFDELGRTLAEANNISSNDRQDLEATLTRIVLVLELLDTSDISPQNIETISSVIREPFISLYAFFPILALKLAAGILAKIFKKYYSQTAENRQADLKERWMVVQIKLLSGVHDFLERRATDQSRAHVALAFYPVLCDFYLVAKPACTMGAALMKSIFQLLSETVMSHPENQRQLRDPVTLGPRRLGTILVGLKDFLALEALLELCAKLLPSSQKSDSRKKRSIFVQELFENTQFRSSHTLIGYMESVSASNWEQICLDILHSLARHDITFPQPFDVYRLDLKGAAPLSVKRVYVDEKGLTANVEQGGFWETLHIPYNTFNSTSVAKHSTVEVVVAVELARPPILGLKQISDRAPGRLQIHLMKRDLAHFKKSLESRRLPPQNNTYNKLSKAEVSVSLLFDDPQKPVSSTRDKVNSLQQLWKSDYERKARQTNSTSPLARISTCLLSEQKYGKIDSDVPKRVAQPTLRRSPRELSRAAIGWKEFGTSDDEITDFSLKENKYAKVASARRKHPLKKPQELHGSKPILSKALSPKFGPAEIAVGKHADPLQDRIVDKKTHRTIQPILQTKPTPDSNLSMGQSLKRKGQHDIKATETLLNSSKRQRMDKEVLIFQAGKATDINAELPSQLEQPRYSPGRALRQSWNMPQAPAHPYSSKVEDQVQTKDKLDSIIGVAEVPNGTKTVTPRILKFIEHLPLMLSDNSEKSLTHDERPTEASTSLPRETGSLIVSKNQSPDAHLKLKAGLQPRIAHSNARQDQRQAPTSLQFRERNVIDLSSEHLTDVDSPNIMTKPRGKELQIYLSTQPKNVSPVVCDNMRANTRMKGVVAPRIPAGGKEGITPGGEYIYMDVERAGKSLGDISRSFEINRMNKRAMDPQVQLQEVISEIIDVLGQKFARRFGTVSKEISLGQDSLLRNSLNKFKEMQTQSFGHHDMLIKLAGAYEQHWYDIGNHLESLENSSDKTKEFLAKIVHSHSRRTLLNNWPTKLGALIPSVLQNS